MTGTESPGARTLRRLRVSSGRLAHTGLLPAPRHPCLFMHMPKCGGTSLSQALYATVPIHRRVAVIDAPSTRRAAAIWHKGVDDPRRAHEDLPGGAHTFALREQLLLQHMAWGSWLIHGHLLWSQKAQEHFGDTYKYVTLLRDPVARMVSNYRMAARAGLVRGSFDAYLDGPLARNHARVYLRYLGGLAEVSDDTLDETLALALGRLQSFACVGFLDDIPGFRTAYRDQFGVDLRIGTANAAPDEPPDLSAAQRRTLTALCRHDLMLYECARDAFRAAAPLARRARPLPA
ncbi:sulfotransferase family 2 domain-containing protein [Algicella marina]|uniref:Sulfotransferase family protein n=1 Tax=Algicella marina TaxID=2683284 RepID=A0A6P1T3S9_9RHOB|nr:sulfotransferase family 2 domain-containing protein [Algicella marina]QHQ36411.1 hypothetical protein GO499_15125 [Algicella marina]